MPESMASSLKTPQDLINFFQKDFADSIPLIGQEKLITDFFRNPKSSLMSIKVRNAADNPNYSAPPIIIKIKR